MARKFNLIQKNVDLRKLNLWTKTRGFGTVCKVVYLSISLGIYDTWISFIVPKNVKHLLIFTQKILLHTNLAIKVVIITAIIKVLAATSTAGAASGRWSSIDATFWETEILTESTTLLQSLTEHFVFTDVLI